MERQLQLFIVISITQLTLCT